MSSPLDLCTVADVRAWLGLSPQQTLVVATSITASIAPGLQTVTPLTMANITTGSVLQIGTGATVEFVMPVSSSGTTFTANFAYAHTGPVTVGDVTDTVLQRVVSGVSVGIHRKMGRLNADGSLPTLSTLKQRVDFNERYSGTGTDRLYLRYWPIASVTSLTIGNMPIPPSDGVLPGYMIDRRGRSLVMVSCGYKFQRGMMNTHVVYTGGFVATPDDIYDAAIEVTGLNYRRKGWLDQASNQHESMGTVRYQKWEFPPKIDDIISDYRTIAA